MKTLIFEGAGWDGASSSINSGVGNCRIRTRIRNNVGRVIYLEMGGFEVSKNDKREIYKGLSIASHVDHCFYDDAKWDSNSGYSPELREITRGGFEYNKENIIKFVNEKLNCSFNELQVINDISVRVHNTEQPLCDCCEGHYEPYKDIEININVLDSITPLEIYERSNSAKYRLSWESINKILPLKRYISEHSEREINNFKPQRFHANLRWDNNGIINCLEVTSAGSFVCINLGVEELQNVIDLILKDNVLLTKAQ